MLLRFALGFCLPFLFLGILLVFARYSVNNYQQEEMVHFFEESIKNIVDVEGGYDQWLERNKPMFAGAGEVPRSFYDFLAQYPVSGVDIQKATLVGQGKNSMNLEFLMNTPMSAGVIASCQVKVLNMNDKLFIDDLYCNVYLPD